MYIYDDILISNIVESKYGIHHALDTIAIDYEAKNGKLRACQHLINVIKYCKANQIDKIINCGFIDCIPYMISNYDDRTVIDEICKFYHVIYDYDVMTGYIKVKSI